MLAAPAVWGRRAMPVYQRIALWIAWRAIPWVTTSAEGLNRPVSDNLELLEELRTDPLVIQSTRVATTHGLTNLMDQGLAAAPQVSSPVLLLYGLRDQAIPPRALLRFWDALPRATPQTRIVAYEDGFHLLLRGRGGERVLGDIIAWLRAPTAPLPSGADVDALERIAADGPR